MKRFLLFIFLISILYQCAPVKTKTLYDVRNDFCTYKTFCWLSGCEFTYEGPGYYYDSASFERVKTAMIAELTAKGLVQDDNDPDLLVDFHIVLEEKSAIITEHQEYEENEGMNSYPPSYRVYNYLKGSLVIDMVDKAEGRMIWRSSSVGYLEAFPSITEKQITKSVKEALKDFPPKGSTMIKDKD